MTGSQRGTLTHSEIDAPGYETHRAAHAADAIIDLHSSEVALGQAEDHGASKIELAGVLAQQSQAHAMLCIADRLGKLVTVADRLALSVEHLVHSTDIIGESIDAHGIESRKTADQQRQTLDDIKSAAYGITDAIAEQTRRLER